MGTNKRYADHYDTRIGAQIADGIACSRFFWRVQGAQSRDGSSRWVVNLLGARNGTLSAFIESTRTP